MTSQINHKPANPEKVILIATFQNLFLDETAPTEIIGDTTQPRFRNIWANKILLNSKWTHEIIDLIAKIPLWMWVANCLLKMHNICKKKSLLVLCSRIGASVPTITGLKFVLTFFAINFVCWIIYNSIKSRVIDRVKRSWVPIIKSNSLENNLVKSNEWWGSEEGETVYRNHIKGIITKTTTLSAAVADLAGFVGTHLEKISEEGPMETISEEGPKKDVVHVWDGLFLKNADRPKSEEEAAINPELVDKRICYDCEKQVKKISNQMILWGDCISAMIEGLKIIGRKSCCD